MVKKNWTYIFFLYIASGILSYFFLVAIAFGQIKVVDADTIIFNNEKIRLYGIDAPEKEQSCYVKKKAWPCGKIATEYLRNLLKDVSPPSFQCKISSKDRYGRSIGVCYIEDENLNKNLVANGWALAYRNYSKDYILNEKLASQKKIGIWEGEFVKPWDWRRGVRIYEAQNVDCKIKGNISSNGEKIYHVPNSKNYLKTKISTSKGERWFCSEKDAQASGWRKPKK